MNSSFYGQFFDRIPDTIIRGIGNGCNIGDKAYNLISTSEPRLFGSKYTYGLRTRIHDKAIQLYLHDRLDGINSVQLYSKNTGFGNRILYISGKDFIMTPCHVTQMDELPYPAKYKLKSAAGNPGDDSSQLTLFAPPVVQQYLNVYFLISIYFEGMNTIPKIVLPNNSFTRILESKSVLSVITSEEENAYQERIIPRLIHEVEKEHEQDNG